MKLALLVLTIAACFGQRTQIDTGHTKLDLANQAKTYSLVVGLDPQITAVLVDGQPASTFAAAGPWTKTAQVDSTVISWTTALPATGQVQVHGNTAGACGDPSPYLVVPYDVPPVLTTAHSITLNGLNPNSVYCFKVVSSDASHQAWLYPVNGPPAYARLSFQTGTVDPTAAKKYRIDLQAPGNIYAGSAIYIATNPVLLGGVDNDFAKLGTPVLTDSSGTAVSLPWYYLCDTHIYSPDGKGVYGDSKSGFSCYRMGGYNGYLKFITPPNLPPGTYTATSTYTQTGVVFPYSWTFNVLAPPAAPVQAPIATVPPLNPATLALRLTRATADGKRFCNAGEFMAFGYEGQVWYYDGGRAFMQLADLTGDKASWMPCAQNILTQFAERNTPAGIQGWRSTPQGLAMAYWRYGDPRFKVAVNNMWGTPFPYSWSIRETGYAIAGGVKMAQINGAASVDDRTLRSIDWALADFDRLFVSQPNILNQCFYDGIMAEGLIDYYEFTAAQGKPDYRIPAAIANMTAWMWANAIITDPSDALYGHAYYFPLLFRGYLPEPHGSTTNLRLGAIYSGLNDLFSPAWAWLWNLTGDPKYQVQGDALFDHGFDEDATGIYNGKQYSQHFKWSPDYIHYRSSATPVFSVTDPSNNKPDAVYAWNTALPVISAIAVQATDTTAVITWTTDKPASSWAQYGAAPGKYTVWIPSVNGPADSLAGMRTDHTLLIATGLTASTTYHFAVLSRDALGNDSISADQTFATAAVVLP